MMRKILVSNDDGIDSEGLVRLAETAVKFGEVWVVAPQKQYSAMSHSATFWTSVDVWPVEFPVEGVHAYVTSGTPSDCVSIGLTAVVPGGPDNVFCGINCGFNIASDIQYSATVGAAMEAANHNIHTIAFSECHAGVHEVTDRYLESIASELIGSPLNRNEIWNVNFPGCSLEECGGIRYGCVVSQDDFYAGGYDVVARNGERVSYQVNFARNWKGSEGTDLDAIINNCVSVGKVRNYS